jgi:pimeloyl-ACP methyl ester carboxylesterase
MVSSSISFKGISVAYEVHGEGPAVLLLHGFLESKSMWKSMVPGLSKGRRLILVDLPGHGETNCLGYVHTMEEMAEAAIAVLKHLKVRRFDVVGHSMGGYVALALTEAWPDAVRSTTLFFSTSKPDSVDKRADRDRAIALVKRDPRGFVSASYPSLFGPGEKPAGFKAQLEVALQTTPQGIVAALEGMKVRSDREVLLHFGPAPVYFISGRLDPRITLADVADEHLAAKVKEVVLLDCGHMGHLEAPEACTEALRRFTAQ